MEKHEVLISISIDVKIIYLFFYFGMFYMRLYKNRFFRDYTAVSHFIYNWRRDEKIEEVVQWIALMRRLHFICYIYFIDVAKKGL